MAGGKAPETRPKQIPQATLQLGEAASLGADGAPARSAGASMCLQLGPHAAATAEPYLGLDLVACVGGTLVTTTVLKSGGPVPPE